MTPAEFRSWRHRLGLTQSQAAAVLDRSKQWVYNIEAGRLRVERVVELACWAVEARRMGQQTAASCTTIHKAKTRVTWIQPILSESGYYVLVPCEDDSSTLTRNIPI